MLNLTTVIAWVIDIRNNSNMATREQIEKEILKKAKNDGLEVDWKELALQLLEWQSNLYSCNAANIIRRCLHKPNDSK